MYLGMSACSCFSSWKKRWLKSSLNKSVLLFFILVKAVEHRQSELTVKSMVFFLNCNFFYFYFFPHFYIHENNSDNDYKMHNIHSFK